MVKLSEDREGFEPPDKITGLQPAPLNQTRAPVLIVL
jgi:hypothetical protein